MSEKPYKLRQVEVKPDGSAVYERIEERTLEDYVDELRAVTKSIATETKARSAGVREAIRARALSDEQRKALGDTLMNIIPL